MKAVCIHQTGGPDVLIPENMSLGTPGAGEILVRNRAVGVNFTDIYSRRGVFPPASFPFVPGKEAAGEVIEVGAGVTDFKPGDRIAYVETLGAYAEMSIVPEHFVVHLPESVNYVTAAAAMLKGLTAHFLSHRTFRVKPGQTVMIHAVAGGVGTILSQWVKHLGATVIGTVGSAEKVDIARRNGCDHVINYNEEDFVERVKNITGGKGCDVVYDGVGKATFPGSLDCLRPFGFFVSYGMASGAIPPFDIRILAEKGSLYATWPGLTQYLNEREDVIAMSRALFEVIASGGVKIEPPLELPLESAEEAHRQLESRSATRTMVLIP